MDTAGALHWRNTGASLSQSCRTSITLLQSMRQRCDSDAIRMRQGFALKEYIYTTVYQLVKMMLLAHLKYASPRYPY